MQESIFSSMKRILEIIFEIFFEIKILDAAEMKLISWHSLFCLVLIKIDFSSFFIRSCYDESVNLSCLAS